MLIRILCTVLVVHLFDDERDQELLLGGVAISAFSASLLFVTVRFVFVTVILVHLLDVLLTDNPLLFISATTSWLYVSNLFDATDDLFSCNIASGQQIIH